MNNKRGSSLVELIAVIVIMGIIASISTITIINVINRQRNNAALNSLENIYSFTRGRLLSIEAGDYDDFITVVNDSFCYVTLNTLIESGAVDGEDYKSEGNDVFFCYDMNEIYVVIDTSYSLSKPSSTGSTMVNGVSISFDYSADKFIKA